MSCFLLRPRHWYQDDPPGLRWPCAVGLNIVGRDNNDDQGHGTHVAGTFGGITYGIAKQTALIAVKVFEGAQGPASAVIAGFDWAFNNIVSKGRQNSAVTKMSPGSPGSTVWDRAITAAWNRGALAVVSSGSENSLPPTACLLAHSRLFASGTFRATMLVVGAPLDRTSVL